MPSLTFITLIDLTVSKDTWVGALLTRLLLQELKRRAHKPDQAESFCCKTLWLLLWKPGWPTWHLSVLLFPSGHQDSGNLLMVFVHHYVQRNKKNRTRTPHRYLVIYLQVSVFLSQDNFYSTPSWLESAGSYASEYSIKLLELVLLEWVLALISFNLSKI